MASCGGYVAFWLWLLPCCGMQAHNMSVSVRNGYEEGSLVNAVTPSGFRDVLAEEARARELNTRAVACLLAGPG